MLACACGEAIPGAKRTIENRDYVIAFATVPARIAVGEHFAVDLAVCPRGQAPAAETVRVDASMPEHKHGMN